MRACGCACVFVCVCVCVCVRERDKGTLILSTDGRIFQLNPSSKLALNFFEEKLLLAETNFCRVYFRGP